MNNITEKYNGKNGNEGDVLYFIITNYQINLKTKRILVEYEMVSNNLLDNYEKGRVKKSYTLQDEKEIVSTTTKVVEEPLYNEEGEMLTEGVYEQVEVVVREENLAFTEYQKFPLQYGVDNGMETLEDVFFINTRNHILHIHGYTEEDLFIKEEEEDLFLDDTEELE